MTMIDPDPWHFLLTGYLLSIAVKTPILLIGLSAAHSFHRRLFAGIWLTACSYPIVILVLPILLQNVDRSLYLLVAETFAPVSECLLFAIAFYSKGHPTTRQRLQDMITITLANLASFGFGQLAWQNHWL